MGMNNVTTEGAGGLGGLGGIGGTDAPPPGSTGFDSTDQISPSVAAYIAQVTDSNNPFIIPPAVDENGNVIDYGTSTPEEVESQLRQILENQITSTPGFSALLDQLAEKYMAPPQSLSPDQAKSKAMNDLVKGLVDQVKAMNGGTLPDHIDELNVNLGTLTGNVLIHLAQENNLPGIAEGIKFHTLVQNNPEVQVLADILYSDLISKGLPPDVALATAQNKAMSMVDDYFSAEGTKRTTFGTNPMIRDAVMSQLLDFLTGFSSEEAIALVTGVVDSMNVSSAFIGWMESVANIVPNEEQSLIGALGLALAENLITSSDELLQTATEIINDLPLAPGEKVAMLAYLKIIGEMISEIKAIINELAIADARNRSDAAKEQVSINKLIHASTMDALKKQMEQAKKAAGMRFMKWLMPLISVVLMVIAVLASPFTGGAALVAMIAVMVVLFAVTTVLSETGALQEAMTAIMEELTDALANIPGIDEDTAKALAGAIMIMAIIAIIVLAIICPGASALVSTIVMTVTIQLASMALMSSGAISSLVAGVGAKTGADEEEIAAWTTAITIIIMIAIAIATAGKMKSLGKASSTSTSQPGPKMQAFLDKVKFIQNNSHIIMGATLAIQGGLSVAQAVNSIQLANLDLELGELEALTEMLQAIKKGLEKLLESLQGGGEEFMDIIQSLSDTLDKVVTGLQEALAGATQTPS